MQAVPCRGGRGPVMDTLTIFPPKNGKVLDGALKTMKWGAAD